MYSPLSTVATKALPVIDVIRGSLCARKKATVVVQCSVGQTSLLHAKYANSTAKVHLLKFCSGLFYRMDDARWKIYTVRIGPIKMVHHRTYINYVCTSELLATIEPCSIVDLSKHNFD